MWPIMSWTLGAAFSRQPQGSSHQFNHIQLHLLMNLCVLWWNWTSAFATLKKSVAWLTRLLVGWWHSLLAQDHYRLDLESRRNVVRLSYQQALDRWKARTLWLVAFWLVTITKFTWFAFHKSLLDLHCWDWKTLTFQLVFFCIVLPLLHWYVSPVSCAELAPCLAKTAASAEHSLATMAFGNSSAGKGATGALATATAAYRATCRTLQGGYQVTLHHLEVA